MRRSKPFAQWKIRTQIFVCMTALALIVALTLSFGLVRIAQQTLETNYRVTCENNLRIVNDVLEMRLDTIVKLVREAVFSDDFQTIIQQPNPTGSPYYSTLSSQNLDAIWNNMEYQNELLDSMFLFDLEGRFYKRRLGAQSTNNYQIYYTQPQPVTAQWYQSAVEAKGREVFFGYDVLDPTDADARISMVKLVYDPANRTPKAMVIVCLRSSLLRKILPKSDPFFKTSTYYLLDERDQVIYAAGSASLSDDEVGKYLHSPQDNGHIFSSCESAITGWTLANAVERQELNAMVGQIGLSAILLAGLLTLVSLLLINAATQYMNRSLTHLKIVLEEINRKGGSITDDFDDSEIGQFGKVLKSTYNHNLALQASMLKLEVSERESELMLLQAQINPHFLYNTLDSIYSSAIVSHDDRTAAMVSSLSGLFRLSLNKGKRIITVAEELMYIQRYMTIQNFRFQDRFALIMDVDDNVLSLTILKLILQPFVENAMVHGLEPKLGRGYIEIKGERIEDDLFFTISDNGVGAADRARFYDGYGIRNVIDRIHLFYGKEYGVDIHSTPAHGTSVRIHLPAKEEDPDAETGDL